MYQLQPGKETLTGGPFSGQKSEGRGPGSMLKNNSGWTIIEGKIVYLHVLPQFNNVTKFF